MLLLGTTALSLCFAPLAFHCAMRFVLPPPASVPKPPPLEARVREGGAVSDAVGLTAGELRQRRDEERRGEVTG